MDAFNTPLESFLQQRAFTEGGSDEDIEQQVKEAVTDTCRVSPFVSYDQASDAARELEEVVFFIEEY